MAKKENLQESATELKILKILKELVKNGANINDTAEFMMTPLHGAARHGYNSTIKFLIENGAPLNSTISGSKENGFTPLHLAVLNGHLDSAKLLLESGASVSLKIKDVCHPIHIAVYKNNVEMVNLLCRYGADVNDRFFNKFFETFEHATHRSLWLDHDLPLLHYSILGRMTTMIKLLFELKVDVGAKTSLGKTTLMQAVEVNSIEWVEYLVNVCRAKVNDRDVFGQPVLHFTILNANRKVSAYSKEECKQAHSKLSVIKFLRKKGANINARFPANQKRSSVIHYMIKYGYSLGVQYLLSCYELNFDEIDLRTIKTGRISKECLTPDVQKDFNYMIILKRQFEMITYYIIIKTIDLRMMGLPADLNLILPRPLHPWVSMNSHIKIINSWKISVCDQVQYMKNRKIGDSNITVWRLMTCTMSQLVKLMCRKSLRDFEVTKDKELVLKMNNYFKILKDRLNCAKKLKIRLERTTEAISTMLIDHLPYDCCEKIVKYMIIKD